MGALKYRIMQKMQSTFCLGIVKIKIYFFRFLRQNIAQKLRKLREKVCLGNNLVLIFVYFLGQPSKVVFWETNWVLSISYKPFKVFLEVSYFVKIPMSFKSSLNKPYVYRSVITI